MSFFKDMLSDGRHVSVTRVMALLSLITGCFVGIYGITHGKDCLGLASLFVSSAFGAKVISQHLEK